MLKFIFKTFFFRVGGTTGAILTCPLEVVKTRLQSSNSGFETRIPNNGTGSAKTSSGKSLINKYWSRIDKVTCRPIFGSHYRIHLLSGGSGHFGSSSPLLFSTQYHPYQPEKPKLNVFSGRTTRLTLPSSMNVHTVPSPSKPNSTLGVWDCLK